MSAGARFERQYAVLRGIDIYEETESGNIILVTVA